MKISMWMILEKLERYHPSYVIRNGEMCITGIRFVPESAWTAEQSQYVYVRQENRPDGEVQIDLVNGCDQITFCGNGLQNLLNDLLEVFDFYNSWEASLWEAASHKSFQEIIDIGNTVLNNPILLSDMEGNVLAMSSAFVDQDLSAYWRESRDSNRVPNALSGAPLRTMTGEPASWTDTPDIYIMPGGSKLIGTYLRVNEERIAGFGVWEYHRPIVTSDIWMVKILCDVLTTTMDAQKRSLPLHSSAAFLANLLSGAQLEEGFAETIDAKCPRPWRLIRIDNPLRNDEINQRNLLQRLWTAKYPCIPFIYEGAIVVLSSQHDTEPLLNSIFNPQQKLYDRVSVSLPFDDLRRISILYGQTSFIAKKSAGTPGFYYGENYALSQLLSLFGENEQVRALLHPALSQLGQYDAAKKSNLYETLYQYLLHEHGIQAAADAMHVHRNTFIYRLERAREIADFDAEDPVSRIYLLLSYLIEEQKNIHDGIPKD